MARLVIIRHGETDYNLCGLYCGSNNPSLNEKGRRQAGMLARKLRYLRPDKVYSSDLKRAVQTARIIFKDSRIIKTAAFREMNFGIFEGLTHEMIIEQHRNFYKRWLKDPMRLVIPEAEAPENFRARVRNKLFSILSRHNDGTIALVSHGGPIRIILNEVLKYGLDRFWDIGQDVCALTIIEYAKNSPIKIIKMNDTSHLCEKKGLS